MLHVSTSREGRIAVWIGTAGIASALVLIACIALTGIHVSVGPLNVLGALVFAALVAVVAAGVPAGIAVVRRGERSKWVLGMIAASLVALFAIVSEAALGT